jgi:hypothetical protein
MNFSDLESPASSSLFSSPGMDFGGVGGTASVGGSGAGLGAGINPQDTAELQEWLAMEQEKARMRTQVGLI